MKPIDTKDGLMLLRPLLNVRREDITRWLIERNETWRDDATNDIADVTRNRLRHEVIPTLNQALGRDVTPILCRSARLQDETHSALQSALQALPLLDPQQRLYLPFVITRNAALRKAIVRYYLKMNNVPQIDEATVIRVNDILNPSTASASRICLPGGYMAIRRNKRLIIEQPV
jgi:tRNA(Ile)-lysidine synthase